MSSDHGVRVHSRIIDTPLSVDRALNWVSSDHYGAISLFIGTVRDHHDGRAVTSLSYQAHPHAETLLTALCHAIASENAYAGSHTVFVEHRVGDVSIGESAVVIAVGAAHRASACDLSRQLIERIKTDIPIWKHERFADGTAQWVGAP